MLSAPQIVTTEATLAAVLPITVPRHQIQQVMGPGIAELMSTLAAQGITPTGPWFTRHVRLDPEVFDFEIGVPVASPVTPAGRVRAGALPAATVARAVLHGDYSGLASAWGELGTWVTGQGLTQADALWEVYLVDPSGDPDPAAWRTELNRPLLG